MIQILRSRPHLWFQLYWVIYLVWFFALDWTITDPTYIIHSPIDDLIPSTSGSSSLTAAGFSCCGSDGACCGGSIPGPTTSSA